VTTSDQRESRLAQTTALIVDDDAAKPKTSGHKNTATAEARGEDILSAHRAKQLDRKTPVTEIKYRIQSIFDRVAHEASLPGSERCRDISLEKGSELKTNKEQWNELVDLYRTVGGETVAAKWEEYLVQDDHEVTELVDECEEDGKLTGRKITQTVQRTYLLRRFLEKYDYVLRQSMPVFIPSSVSDDGSVVEIELAGACGEKPKEQV
jgi:restriction endonuclease